MAIAAIPQVSDSRVALDEVLALICEEVQISESRFNLAEQRYHAIADWVDADDSPLHRFSPIIYPQGSMAIGTTVHPIGRQEFDLDMVCEFRTDLFLLRDAVEVLNALESRMRQHGQYRTMIERKKRCVTITYANDFHLDILPAKPDAAAGQECVVVPDRKLESWVASNPRGYAQWFLARAALRRVVALDKAAAAPIPAQETAERKAVLKLAVQLWKRWRDVRHGTSDLAPRSIILTTLAANHYRGQASVSEALFGILQSVSDSLPAVGRLFVRNPKNDKEDFSESWDDEAKYRTFVNGVRQLQSDMESILRLRGTELTKKLEFLFGEYVKSAFEKQAARVSQARSTGTLRIASGGAVVVGGSGLAIKPNNFYAE